MIRNLPKSLVDSATKLLLESTTYPKHALIGRLKDAVDSGRYDIVSHSEDHNYHEFMINAKKPQSSVDFQFQKGRPHISWHDPEISETYTPHPTDPYPRTYPKLKPSSGYHNEVQEEKTPGVIYRGMSHEEFQNVKKLGYIQSKGAQNLDGQEGLTYYSHDPKQAQSYANSFATVENKPSGIHKAYVVAVKNPGTDVRIPGVGEDEVGIPHKISTDDILHVHEGRVYAAHPGSYSIYKGWDGLEEGSSGAPIVHVGWKKKKFEEL